MSNKFIPDVRNHQLLGSVGAGGSNNLTDVKVVQKVLAGCGLYKGRIDGYYGPKTDFAIREYQKTFISPDGRVDVDGKTWRHMKGDRPRPTIPVHHNPPFNPGAAAIPPAVSANATSGNYPSNLMSGAHWCSNAYPGIENIVETDRLSADFRPKAERFLDALRAAGASVTIDTTLRPRKRALLMHYCVEVYQGRVSPQDATQACANGVSVKGQTVSVPINWVHSTLQASKDAANKMMKEYHIAFPASLTSNHIDGNAIDMTITWSGTLSIVNASGQIVTITTSPRTGSGNTDLHTVGRSYGVQKKLNDRPHWSHNGR